jgi:hypothetical protein
MCNSFFSIDVDVGDQVPDTGGLPCGHLGLKVPDLFLQFGVTFRHPEQLLLHRLELHPPVESASLRGDVVQGSHAAVAVFHLVAGLGLQVQGRTRRRWATSGPGKISVLLNFLKYLFILCGISSKLRKVNMKKECECE